LLARGSESSRRCVRRRPSEAIRNRSSRVSARDDSRSSARLSASRPRSGPIASLHRGTAPVAPSTPRARRPADRQPPHLRRVAWTTTPSARPAPLTSCRRLNRVGARRPIHNARDIERRSVENGPRGDSVVAGRDGALLEQRAVLGVGVELGAARAGGEGGDHGGATLRVAAVVDAHARNEAYGPQQRHAQVAADGRLAQGVADDGERFGVDPGQRRPRRRGS